MIGPTAQAWRAIRVAMFLFAFTSCATVPPSTSGHSTNWTLLTSHAVALLLGFLVGRISHVAGVRRAFPGAPVTCRAQRRAQRARLADLRGVLRR